MGTGGHFWTYDFRQNRQAIYSVIDKCILFSLYLPKFICAVFESQVIQACSETAGRLEAAGPKP